MKIPMIVTKDTTLRELNEAPELAVARDSLISGGGYFEGETADLSLEDLNVRFGTWSWKDMVYGVTRLLTALKDRGDVCRVYSGEEIAADPRKEQAKLFWLPADRKRHPEFVILMSGGAYGAVCTLPESLPVAAKLNELGFDCFCLNYRTAVPEDIENGLFPKPADDFAAAWNYIREREQDFGVEAENYIAGGFSAGGHLAAMWGTAHKGARHYDIPQPKMLMLDYPLISTDTMDDGPVKTFMLNMMFGEGHDRPAEEEYMIHRHIDRNYPPVYHVQALDDPTVLPVNASLLKAALEQMDVPYRQELTETGGHGFGLGSEMDAAGWVDRAVKFYEEVIK